MATTEETIIEAPQFSTGSWYRDLVKAHSTKLPKNAITVKQFAEDADISERRAREILKAQMKTDSSFHGKKVAKDGHRCWVFWSEE
jgi:hypothetical protein